ncbi:MAG: mechanosensitive ion channel family protein [Lachnospiraceae bacterium]|nr:mechanosensitive ion channel family protein [Lachnospiraceae bacterium]
MGGMTFLTRMMPESVQRFFEEDPSGKTVRFFINLASVVIYFLMLFALLMLLQKINKIFFEFLEKKRGRKIHLQFLERVINILIVIIVVIIPLAGDKIGTSILGSAAVLTAVVGFAAQDVIKDVLSGLLISIYKPFDIGDKIELDDGTIGIVESITMRHVVVIRLDNLRDVIPNSKLNEIAVINYSIGSDMRSELFSFNVSYDSDIEKVKEVISRAIENSSYSKPGVKDGEGNPCYGSVFFTGMKDSSLEMSVRVYFDRDLNILEVRDNINSGVFDALQEAGIEIPYSYTNIVMKK